MGINKLWPTLEPCAINFRPSTIPNMTWLLDFSCMMRFMMGKHAVLYEFYEGRKDDNRSFRDECRQFLTGLFNVRVKPIVVFDGKRSAIKTEEGAKRDKKKKKKHRRS